MWRRNGSTSRERKESDTQDMMLGDQQETFIHRDREPERRDLRGGVSCFWPHSIRDVCGATRVDIKLVFGNGNGAQIMTVWWGVGGAVTEIHMAVADVSEQRNLSERVSRVQGLG